MKHGRLSVKFKHETDDFTRKHLINIETEERQHVLNYIASQNLDMLFLVSQLPDLGCYCC